jgi:hypothetical protein
MDKLSLWFLTEDVSATAISPPPATAEASKPHAPGSGAQRKRARLLAGEKVPEKSRRKERKEQRVAARTLRRRSRQEERLEKATSGE